MATGYLSAGDNTGTTTLPGTSGLNAQLSLPRPSLITPDVSVAGLLNIEADFQQALDTTAFAVAHATAADNYIAQLGQLAASLVPPTINPTFPINPNTPAITTPVAPTLLPTTFSIPPTPLPFDGNLSVDTILPEFDATPPQLIFPNAPTLQNLPLPASPSLNLNFSYPTIDVELPTPPSLLSINVVPFDGVTIPTFSGDVPVLTLSAPSIVSYVPDAPYTDALLSGLIGTLQERLSIGVTGKNTGLPPGVEENIWNRGREREYRQQAAAIRALDKMEAMGYALPPGAHLDARIRIETEMGATMVGLSRDVMIKQAELEQSNIQKAMDIAADIEGKLITYANERDQRNFDACKYATDAAVSIYNAGVQAFAAKVSAFRASVDVYTAQIQGARAVVDVYTAEIQAEKLKIDANESVIQQYRTLVDAAQASIAVFEAQIKIVQTQADIEKTKVEVFGTQVQAFTAQVNAQTAQIEQYKVQIEAEGTKENVYKTQADVYGTIVDAQVKNTQAQVEVFKALIQEKTAEYGNYSAQVQAQAENVRAIAASNTATAQLYSAEVQGTSSYNDAMVKEWEAYNQTVTSIAQVSVSAAQAQGQLYLTAKSVATDAAKVGAQVEAQLAASALGTVTWATHRSRQDNYSKQQSVSFQSSVQSSQQNATSISTQYSNDMLPRYSFNNNTNISGGTSTSYNHNIASVE